MGRIRMAQAVDASGLVDLAHPQSRVEGPSGVLWIHGTGWGALGRAAWLQPCRKKPQFGTMQLPKGAQVLKCVLGQGYEPLLIAFATNPEHFALPIDVIHLKSHALTDAQTTTINRLQTDTVDRDPHRSQNGAHFLAAQNHRQFVFAPRAHQLQDWPRLFERNLKKEANAVGGNFERLRRDFSFPHQVKEVGAQLLIGKLMGTLVVVLSQT